MSDVSILKERVLFLIDAINAAFDGNYKASLGRAESAPDWPILDVRWNDGLEWIWYDIGERDIDHADFIMWAKERFNDLGLEWSERTVSNANGHCGYMLSWQKFDPGTFRELPPKAKLADLWFDALFTALVSPSLSKENWEKTNEPE